MPVRHKDIRLIRHHSGWSEAEIPTISSGQEKTIKQNTTLHMNHKDQILEKIKSNKEVVGIIGLGYVGLPLAVNFAEASATLTPKGEPRAHKPSFNE